MSRLERVSMKKPHAMFNRYSSASIRSGAAMLSTK